MALFIQWVWTLGKHGKDVSKFSDLKAFYTGYINTTGILNFVYGWAGLAFEKILCIFKKDGDMWLSTFTVGM